MNEVITDIDKKAYFPVEFKVNNKVDKKKTFELFKTLTPKPSYYQIGYNGLLFSTQDLFQLAPEIREISGRNPSKPLHKDKSFIYSMFYLNKLNGICQIENNQILFFNGDKYKFMGIERSYTNSLGNYLRNGKVEKKGCEGAVYWDRFFSQVNLCRFHNEMEEVLHNLYLGKIDKGRRRQFTFNKNEM